jgi:4-hydroxy-2-oxoheptanedioate aldolase
VRQNTLRELLKAGKPTLGTHIHSTWPSVIEAIAHTGQYDYVEFVAEYAPYTLHDLDNMCRAAELHNLSSMIKVDQAGQQLVAQHAIGSTSGRRKTSGGPCVSYAPRLPRTVACTASPPGA